MNFEITRNFFATKIYARVTWRVNLDYDATKASEVDPAQVLREFLIIMKSTITLPKFDLKFSSKVKGDKLVVLVLQALHRIKNFSCILNFFTANK